MCVFQKAAVICSCRHAALVRRGAGRIYNRFGNPVILVRYRYKASFATRTGAGRIALHVQLHMDDVISITVDDVIIVPYSMYGIEMIT